MTLTRKLFIAVCVMLVATLVSFSCIGTTYAKYVSGVHTKPEIKAAGFLVQAGTPATATIAGEVDIAPGESATINVPITYFSQVPTSFRELSDIHITGFGALADFSLLRSDFMNYLLRLGKSGNIPTSLADSFSITFGNNLTVCGEMMYLLRTQGLLRQMTPADSSFTDPIISAMSASATSPIKFNMPITITWIEHNDALWDAWDTFLGETFHESNEVSGIKISLELVAEQYEGEVS